MCGLTGLITLDGGLSVTELESIGNAMLDPIKHRGPDDAGIWRDAESQVVLGHRRLSVLDLSPAGHQPMVSANGRYVVTMNGEIYNHQELRRNLTNYSFRGHSDTETAVAVIQDRGVPAALEQFVGMFAFAVWDRSERTLYLARDRLGEKPMYYGTAPGAFLYGSELKAFKGYRRWAADIDREALGLLLRHCYIPAPYTIFSGIRKLLPGTWVTVTRDGANDEIEEHSFWSARDLIEHRVRPSPTMTPEAAVDELEQIISSSVAGQMIADVPLGAFLSGGIDSSLIVALMQAQSTRKVKTFSIGFHEKEYNEADHAKGVADHLGTDHTELYVTPNETRDVIPMIPEMYDEPFADSSQIPTYLVSKLARQHVTVALSGDGGDELFGGYSRYAVGREQWQPIAATPKLVRVAGLRAIRAVSPGAIDRVWRLFGAVLPRQLAEKQLGQALHRRAGLWRTDSQEQIYRALISLWQDPASVVIGYNGSDVIEPLSPTLSKIDDFSETMMFTDMLTYLPDDILVKVDRASMAESLEVRVPFLDHRVVEYAWQIPAGIKVRDGVGKWPLKQILYKYVPRALVDRPKMGFGVPIDHWLRSELRDWAEALLDSQRLTDQGYFHAQPIREKWDAHVHQDLDWHYLLWPVLMFQSWLEHYNSA